MTSVEERCFVQGRMSSGMGIDGWREWRNGEKEGWKRLFGMEDGGSEKEE